MSNNMNLTAPPDVRAAMGIHCPPAVAFDAFIEPSTTKRFWIADSTGPLQAGSTVTWTMNAAGAEATVVVREFDPANRLTFDWGNEDRMSTVDFRFSRWRDGGCHIEVTEAGFAGTGDELAAHAADSTGGFTMVLCSLKALLEHDIELSAVTDRHAQ